MDENDYILETRLSGALVNSYGAITLIPITHENVYSLKQGDWIWDDKPIERPIHERSLGGETVMEPIGFRQVHILDLDGFGRWNYKPFMLSDIDKSGYRWEYFEENRFYICGRKE